MTPAGSRASVPGAPEVVGRLRALGATVATAESLTGGLVCAALVGVPGASTVVRGGVVAYAPEVKHEALGVPAEVVRRHGTVSRECAEAMAAGASRMLHADWAVATTGVAGPDPSEGRPVGTVHVAVCGHRDGEHITAHRALRLQGDRAQIRTASVSAALRLLHDTLPPTLSDRGCTVGDHPGETARSTSC
ncbi:CinA family protein [Ornithinimicrobium flavum]|uniref:CinA family protein n=1 Tax=Ornithinimicrobium flavum TaxID=1288636 RepID=UPI00106FBCC1|nr:CinA family protein [Ornithinimicrobium flavum]